MRKRKEQGIKKNVEERKQKVMRHQKKTRETGRYADTISEVGAHSTMKADIIIHQWTKKVHQLRASDARGCNNQYECESDHPVIYYN